MSKEIYYFDKEAGRIANSRGGLSPTPPKLVYQDKPVWEYRIMSKADGVWKKVDLSVYLTWAWAVDDNFDSEEETDVMCRTLDADIDSSGKADGIIVVKGDADTDPFKIKVGVEPNIKAYARLRGVAADGSKLTALHEIVAWNDPDPVGGTPPDPPSDLVTFTEGDVRYAARVIGNQVELPVGTVQIVIGSATVYRSFKIVGDVEGDGLLSRITISGMSDGVNVTVTSPPACEFDDVTPYLSASGAIAGGNIILTINNTTRARSFVFAIQELMRIAI